MRVLAASLFAPVLAMMLVLTTPVGTGGGVHENELLHPVFGHVHLIDGRIVSDQQLAAALKAAALHRMNDGFRQGPALGAGTGPDAAGFGLGLVPALPVPGLVLAALVEGRLLVSATVVAREFRDAPEDPPPHISA